MTQFRMVRAEIWLDELLMDLEPDSRYIYLYLLTGPHTTSVSGLSRISKSSCAEDIGIAPNKVECSFDEMIAKGILIYDERRKLAFLPREFEAMPPVSYKQVSGAFKTLERIGSKFINDHIIHVLGRKLRLTDAKIKAEFEKGIDRVSDRVSNGYQGGICKNKYKNKEKKKNINKDLNTSATTETDAEIIHLPTASGDVWHDVKNLPTELKTTKKAKISTITEKPSQVIKKAWFELYRENYNNSEYPQWGARHNTCANKLFGEATGGLPAILQNMRRYFDWRKRQVVNSGATFCEGYSSFCFSYTQLVNDFTKPERHLEGSAEDNLWQKRRQKAEQDTLDAAMRLLEQEANNGSKASGF